MEAQGKHYKMPRENERTPLIQQVPVADHHERYPHHTVGLIDHTGSRSTYANRAQLRRYCTIGLTVVPILTLAIIFLAIAVTGSNDVFGEPRTNSTYPPSTVSTYDSLPNAQWPQPAGLAYEDLKQILQETPDPEKAREWSKYYTAGPHLCGKNLSQAEWTRDLWSSFGIPHSEIVSYDMYLNYPKDHRLALLVNGKVEFEATLEEDVLPEDPTTGLQDSVPTFHGYSASGSAKAPYVFCNYGTYADFEELQKAGVELEGKIALVKYGGIFRGLKVKRASELGMAGTVMYSDPGDDGEVTEENGYKTYPDGPARHPSSVQRGSVQYLSKSLLVKTLIVH